MALRTIFSKNALTSDERGVLDELLEEINFICSETLVSDQPKHEYLRKKSVCVDRFRNCT